MFLPQGYPAGVWCPWCERKRGILRHLQDSKQRYLSGSETNSNEPTGIAVAAKEYES
jgi:hypothetical protein